MKKVLFLGVIALLCLSAQAWGQEVDEKRAYVGIGASYAVENFDLRTGPASYDNTWGLNVRAGYEVKKWLSVEFDFDYLSEFTIQQTRNSPVPGSDPPTEGPTVSGGDLTLTTHMVIARIFPPFDSKTMKPYLSAGAGLMRWDWKSKSSALGVTIGKGTGSDSDLCTSLGLGVDFVATENITVGVEGSHVWGLDDLDDLKYFKLGLGAAYHF
jgi:opacity protein-like surface antigen